VKRKIIISAVLILLMLSLAAGLFSRRKNRIMDAAGVIVSAEDFKKEITANGEIRATESYKLISRVSAAVLSLPFETGDYIDVDEPVIILDDYDLQLQIETALSTLTTTRRAVMSELMRLQQVYYQADTILDQAKRDYNRASRLQEIGSASDEELRLKKEAYDNAEDSLLYARQELNFREDRAIDDNRIQKPLANELIVEQAPEVSQALSQYKSLLSQLRFYHISSQLAGTLTELNVEKGSVVSPGIVLSAVHDSTHLEIEAPVDEVDLSYIQKDQKAVIESDSFIGSSLEGVVSHIDPVIVKSGDSRVCRIIIDITDDPDGLARIGASCSVFITVKETFQVPSVPSEAYFIEDGQKYVYRMTLLDEGKDLYTLEKTAIETGILGIGSVEVLTGLEIADLVVSSGVQQFDDDMKVRFIQEEAPEESSEKEMAEK